ncbi:hypothetical protein GDO81_020883 [Engystomops pustulosus]|uniref:Uncharacterized protein n=1 Tax=Engystomops pustulosus TaxID=76066 RepID=A0AAV6YWV5_ENGPU|nr:hypothetical protein GDO81_020883 [Engystomops pustulosus]
MKFMQISNKYALDLIMLNLEFLQQEICKLQDNRTQMDQALKGDLTSDDYKTFMDSIAEKISLTKSEQEQTKRIKWARDQDDYRIGKIYAWQGTHNQPSSSFNKDTSRKKRRSPNKQSTNTDKQKPSSASQDDFLGLSPSSEREPDGVVNTISDTEKDKPMKGRILPQRTTSNKKK